MTKNIERVINFFLRLLCSSPVKSVIDAPVRKHKYDGTIGSTQGDRKLKNPAKKHKTKNKSILTSYL